MSPEVASSVIHAVACPYCMAPVGARCRGLGIKSRYRSTPHQQRVIADLFKRPSRKAPQ